MTKHNLKERRVKVGDVVMLPWWNLTTAYYTKDPNRKKFRAKVDATQKAGEESE
jgi:hypothetical protein